MAKWIRVSAFKSKETDVSAAAFWSVLRDWGALMAWAGADLFEGTAPAPVIGCDLRKGHSVDVLPCTREIRMKSDGRIPELFEETLLYADSEARFIYYNIEGVGQGGMRNYLATTTVDEVTENRCRVTCSSRFDVPEGGPADELKAFLEDVYERSVIQGMTKVAMQKEAAQ